MTNQQSIAVRSYKLKHNYDVREFLEKYREVLQKAIDEIWKNVEWKEDVKRVLPKLPDYSKSSSLRNILLIGWPYARMYVDSAIRQAYSILKSWRRRYIRGDAGREKPIVKKKFARIRKDLYVFRDGKIRICMIPGKEYLDFNISKAWFTARIPENAEMRELLLNEEYLIVTFRYEEEKNIEDVDVIGWDLNIGTLDGFNPELGWIRYDLRKLYHIHRVYELKRQRLQSLASKKPSVKKILKKYSMRERDRAKDFLHKLTTEISKKYANYIHVFEDLKKGDMLNDSREHNRIVKKSNWKTIINMMSYKSSIMLIDPKNTTKQCSRCGEINKVNEGIYECSKCNLKINRHLNSAINIYMNAKRLKPSTKMFRELTKNIKNLLEPTTIYNI
ncbi:MAG: transposase [Nitrososphaerota archaeon]